ncbi:diiron oxygenase [Acuticoccus kandeliae]|uniref:diiron oxygenase n=1 Tax=Acuticoccus kandeliae TaxID=2073160 RepID=UPI00130051EC|nr:diiron oxygenase [Acuticoccus kandeliae]
MVRSTPRRALPEVNGDSHHYPLFRQPLCIHPAVIARGEDVVSGILLQSCYKYMEDIALTETEVVCRITTRIANGRTPYDFSRKLQQVALTVVTDENYHAYVARDFLDQLSQLRAAPPIAHPKETELSVALAETLGRLPHEFHDEFELIAVAIAENTLTREIIDLRSDRKLDDAFRLSLSDHLGDEAQHSGFFQTFLGEFWRQVHPERRAILGRALPAFLIRYLGVGIEQQFDLAVLGTFGFSHEEAQEIVEDCHDGFTLGPDHPMLGNIVRLLQTAGIMSDAPTREAFWHAGLIARGA